MAGLKVPASVKYALFNAGSGFTPSSCAIIEAESRSLIRNNSVCRFVSGIFGGLGFVWFEVD